MVALNGVPAIGVPVGAGGEWRQALKCRRHRVFTIGWLLDGPRCSRGVGRALARRRRNGGILVYPGSSTRRPGPPSRLGQVPGLPTQENSDSGRELLFTAGSVGASTWLMWGIMLALSSAWRGAVIVVLSAAPPSAAQTLRRPDCPARCAIPAACL